MTAFDKDVAGSDLLGTALPIPYSKFVSNSKEQNFEVSLYKDFKGSGILKFCTHFIFEKPAPPITPNINEYCYLEISIKEATFLKDADTIGK